jgi:uncharacterized protein YeaO (DUF488 family)
MGGKPDVRVRRVYDEPEPDDGTRVLVDRVWPRGLTKDKARLDQWCKQIAPSTQLRKWYSHDPERFEEFDRRYREELDDVERAPALEHLRELARSGTLTLLTATQACRDQPGRRACRPDQGLSRAVSPPTIG